MITIEKNLELKNKTWEGNIEKLSEELTKRFWTDKKTIVREKVTAEEFEKLLITKNSKDFWVDVMLKNYEVDWHFFIENNEYTISITNCIIHWRIHVIGENNSLFMSNSNCSWINIWKIKTFVLDGWEVWDILLSKKTEIGYLSIWWIIKSSSTFILRFMCLGWCIIERWEFQNVILLELILSSWRLDKISFSENIFIGKHSLSWNHEGNSIVHQWTIFSELYIHDFIWSANISFINCKFWTEPDFTEWKKILRKVQEKICEEENKKYENDENTTVKITEIKKKEIIIQKSNLEKTQFHNCDFWNSDVCIKDSNISEIITTNVNLPENIKSNNLDWERENYRQLKSNFSQKWDSYNALIYYDKEMTVLFLKSLKGLHPVDLSILWIWKVISNNWTNWLLSILWIIVINMAFFVLFLNWSGIIFEFNLEYVLHNLKYAYFLSDIESLKELLTEERTFSVKSELIFYLGKVINALLFYQLIISFRKFNKKL